MYNFLLSFSMFLLISLPTIKGILIKSSLLNFSSVLILITLLFVHGRVSKERLLTIFPIIIFFMILLASYFINPDALLGIKQYIKYLILFTDTILLGLLFQEKNLNLFLLMQLLWGVFIALYQLIFKIPQSEEMHYLTIGLPIAIMILIAFSNLFYRKSLMIKGLYALLMVIGYASLFTLFGRGPIIFTSLIIMLFIIFKMLFDRSLKVKIKYLFLFLVSVSGFIWIFFNIIPPYLTERILRISVNSSSKEGRMGDVYIPSMKAISQNPLGYGLDASWDVIGFYPHNIFLEVIISSGIIGLLPLLIIIALFMRYSFQYLVYYDVYSSNRIGLVLTTWYMFFQWNVSYTIASAYALFSLIAIMFVLDKVHLEKGL